MSNTPPRLYALTPIDQTEGLEDGWYIVFLDAQSNVSIETCAIIKLKFENKTISWFDVHGKKVNFYNSSYLRLTRISGTNSNIKDGYATIKDAEDWIYEEFENEPQAVYKLKEVVELLSAYGQSIVKILFEEELMAYGINPFNNEFMPKYAVEGTELLKPVDADLAIEFHEWVGKQGYKISHYAAKGEAVHLHESKGSTPFHELKNNDYCTTKELYKTFIQTKLAQMGE